MFGLTDSHRFWNSVTAFTWALAMAWALAGVAAVRNAAGPGISSAVHDTTTTCAKPADTAREKQHCSGDDKSWPSVDPVSRPYLMPTV